MGKTAKVEAGTLEFCRSFLQIRDISAEFPPCLRETEKADLKNGVVLIGEIINQFAYMVQICSAVNK